MNEQIVIVAGARTPFGAFGGGLSSVSATDLLVVASKGAISRAKVDPALIDEAIFGNVLHTSVDAVYLGRHVVIRSG